jgi:hypothetical protein
LNKKLNKRSLTTWFVRCSRTLRLPASIPSRASVGRLQWVRLVAAVAAVAGRGQARGEISIYLDLLHLLTGFGRVTVTPSAVCVLQPVFSLLQLVL